jgi:hypothetical protein
MRTLSPRRSGQPQSIEGCPSGCWRRSETGRRRLLAVGVGVGLGMELEAEVDEVVGPKRRDIEDRTAVCHGHEDGESRSAAGASP